MDRYKAWVRRHPGIVNNLDWLLCLAAWNPNRLSSSEYTYEIYHAAVGLLSLWHQHILEEDEVAMKRPSSSVWLDALEQVEILIELRAMYLESRGKMSRYGPLIALEAVKAALKTDAWLRYPRHLFLRHPSPSDLHLFESEQGLQDILASLQRLYDKYNQPPAGSGEEQQPEAAGSSSSRPASSASLAVQGQQQQQQPLEPGQPGQPDTSPPAVAADEGIRASSGQGACSACEITPCIADDASGATASGRSGTVGGLVAAICSRIGWSGAAGASEQAADPCTMPSGAACQRCSGRPGATVLADGGDADAAASSSSKGTANGSAGASAAAAVSDGGSSIHSTAAGSLLLRPEDPDAHMGRNLLWLSELLHIWRPVVYVTMLKRYGRLSWRPWLASLGVDLMSGHFRKRGAQHVALAAARAATLPAGPHHQQRTSLLSLALARSLAHPGLSAGEERELFERRRKLLLYALRSPFLDTFIKSWAAPLRTSTARVPLVGLATDYMCGLLDTFTQYYTYTSGSN